jgi:hypothetical protein
MFTRLFVLAVISGLLFLSFSISSPQQASAAGKYDGEWKGKLFCEEMRKGGGGGGTGSWPVPGTRVILPVALTISNGKPILSSSVVC